MNTKPYIAPAMQTLSMATTQVLCASGASTTSLTLTSGDSKSADVKGRDDDYDDDYDTGGSWGDGLW